MRSPNRSLLRFALPLLATLTLLSAAAGLAFTERAAASVPAAASPKIAPGLRALMAGGAKAEFLVVLASQADLSGAYELPTKAQRGRYVYDTLRQQAAASQGPLIAWLKARQVEYRAFYIVNLVWVKGDAAVLEALAARPDVARIDGNPLMPGQTGTPETEGLPAPAGVEPNISYVHANQLWGLGFTGQNIVIGGQDTGYKWDHDALKDKYRGWNGLTASHDYNWHDSIHTGGGSCGADSGEPCDDSGHGTHTMGTALGDDGAGNQVGAVPGAKWIGCRDMDQGNGTPASYIECFEFFLAPYPVGGDPMADGNPSLAPDVTTNSWSCPPSEGCAPESLHAALQAQQAAGILTVAAATNGGSACSTIDDPPSFYPEAYTVGALQTGSDLAAGFSSRGPVDSDGSFRRKPDIAAPGTNVRSSTRDGGYGNLSGTSMATPLVAGAVALLWSAEPSMQGQISLTEQILNETAVHLDSGECGSSGWPNNTFGFGRLDVKAAYDLAVAAEAQVSVTVTSGVGGAPITGADVSLEHGLLTYTATTGLDGSFQMAVLSGTYTITAAAPGFFPATLGGVDLPAGENTHVPMVLMPEHDLWLPLLTFLTPALRLRR
ncbi:MAG: S8 family serine peptidase [Anaerolineales bacterium]